MAGQAGTLSPCNTATLQRPSSQIEPDVHVEKAMTLYHGTSRHHAILILSEGLLKRSRPTIHHTGKVALTDNVSIARYFAKLHGEMEAKCGLSDGSGCILTVSFGDLEAKEFHPAPYSDPVWGEGECDWECEWAVWAEIPADLFTFHFDHPYNGEPPKDRRSYFDIPISEYLTCEALRVIAWEAA